MDKRIAELAKMIVETGKQDAVHQLLSERKYSFGGCLARRFDMGGDKENDALAEAIIARVNQEEAAKRMYTERKMGEQPLQDEHPGLDLALMYAQPGGLFAKVMAPSMAKGMVNGLANGDGAQALIYGLIPETGEWAEISARAAELQEGNTAKYSHYMAVGKGEHLPRHIASNKKALVEKGVTAEGEPYVIRQNSLAPTSIGFLKLPEGYSSPADWAMSGSGSWKVHGKSDGGPIHIKPSHRGRLTELKERTGKTEAELYNDGDPAHKKMVVFARNARKWNKYAEGGLLRVYDGGTPGQVVFPVYNTPQFESNREYSSVGVPLEDPDMVYPEPIVEREAAPQRSVSARERRALDAARRARFADMEQYITDEEPQVDNAGQGNLVVVPEDALQDRGELSFDDAIISAMAHGRYSGLKKLNTKENKGKIEALQRELIEAGFGNMLGKYGVNKDGVDGNIGNATIRALRAYRKQQIEQNKKEQEALAAQRPVVEKIVAEPINNQQDALLSFPEYLYASGAIGTGRRLSNLYHVGRNYVNGILNPHGDNATMSEGARRQMVAASLLHKDRTGSYGITDTEHQILGGMSGHSGQEFRQETDFAGRLGQMMDAPYHNIYGQSGATYDESTGTFSPGPDAYTFNNVWDGDKVVDVKEDGEGDASIQDAFREFVRARESGATVKSAMESAASVRGVDVKPKSGSSNTVSEKQIEKYRKEYDRYLTDKKFRERFERRRRKNG